MSIVDSLLEVKLHEEEDFLKVKETLTRIGIASRKERKLYQSCHILHKQDRYYIVHFKELFLLDGKEANFAEEDVKRRNVIASLLQEWGLIDVVTKVEVDTSAMSTIKIIPFKEKNEWELVVKYNIGRKR